jgi:hypothetical protein
MPREWHAFVERFGPLRLLQRQVAAASGKLLQCLPAAAAAEA